jgi:FkbM family methyltransferase
MRSKTLIRVLTGTYSIVSKMGLFRIPLLQLGLLSASFCYKRWYEDPFWNLMQRSPELLADGDVLDIGANIGYTAWVFAHGVAPDAKVYAFEPDLNSYPSLENVIRRKGLEGRVKPLNIAVGSHEGELEFWHNKNHSADHRIVTEEFRKVLPRNERVVRVPVTTVDRFVEMERIEKLSFIKIDVQGYELAVCQGMSKTLEKFPRLSICLEFAPGVMRDLGFEPNEVLKFFLSRGYRMSAVTREATVLVSDGDTIQRMMGRGEYIDLLFRKET